MVLEVLDVVVDVILRSSLVGLEHLIKILVLLLLDGGPLLLSRHLRLCLLF